MTATGNAGIDQWAARTEQKALRSIGKAFAVSRGGVVWRGVITDVEVAGIRNRGRSYVAQFKVTMECGVGQAVNIQTFTVEKLPR